MTGLATFRRLAATCFALSVATSLPLVAGFFGRLHPAFDSTAHFRVHLAIAMIVLAIPALAGSLRRAALAAMVFGVAALTTVFGGSLFPGLGPVEAAFHPREENSAVYRLLQLNLRFDNPEPGKVLSLIGRLRPDVITLNEVSPQWSEKLAFLSSAYPYLIVCPTRRGADGVAILSLRPLDTASGRCLEGGTLAIAAIDFSGRMVEVGALHLYWPWPFGQSAQIERLVTPLAAMSDDAILAGDLNATPWSEAALRIADAGRLTPVAPIGATWQYRRLPDFLRFAGLPIDQVSTKGDVLVHSARTLEPVGSDHLPVLVEFSIRPVEAEQPPIDTVETASPQLPG